VLVFAMSGFAGLVYEAVWSHYLRILVGSAAYGQSLVLAVFMGGTALGAWAASRRSGRWPNLLRNYAIAEAGLGVFAMAFHPLFLGAEGLMFSATVANGLGSGAATALRWTTAALLILAPSTLLGATFPLMAGGFIRRFPDRPGSALATLYFANAAGGAVGVLASGYALIRLLGLPGTLIAAGLLNLLVAAVVWLGFSTGREPEPKPGDEAARAAPSLRGFEQALLWVAGGAGLASFVYEIVWIRMLSLVLSSSAHAFELMLSAFILGIALGGLWIRSRIDTLSRPLRLLGKIQIAMGILAVGTLPVYVRLFPWMQHLLEALPASPGAYLRLNLWSHGMALGVMLPAALCAGATLPLLTHVLLRAGLGEPSIGRVYGANTLGAVVGALLALHVGMPALGLKGTLAVGAAINLGLGTLLLRYRAQTREPLGSFGWTASGVAVVLAVMVFVTLDPAILSSGVFRRYVDLEEAQQATVLALLSIRTNGKPSASVAASDSVSPTGDETAATLLGALPLALGQEPRRALNIGMGSGITSHVLLASESLETLTTVEIEPAMVELARGFLPRNGRVFSDPRSRIATADARAFLAAAVEPFDLIVTQPFNPWVSGAGSLYSTEFYDVVRARLSAGGLFVQWIPIAEADPPLVASILRSLLTHFPEMRLYAGTSGDVIVVASPSEPLPDLAAAALRNPALTTSLQAVDVRTLQDLGSRTAGDHHTVAAFLDLFPAPANSEYRPYVEQHADRARFMEEGAEELLRLMVQPLPVMEMLGILRPSWSESRVTPAPAFLYSSRSVGAVAFRDLVLLGQEPSRDGGSFARRARDEAMRFQHDCDFQGVDENALPAFYGVAIGIVTDLRPEELNAVWQGLEGWSCVESLTGDARVWVEFFQAVGDRDTVAADRLATTLLGTPEVVTAARARYLVATSMVARIAQDRPAEALAIWEEYADALFDRAEPSSFFRQLIALARGSAPGAVDD
jgi:predicted membrane-bound spermidine synthase